MTGLPTRAIVYPANGSVEVQCYLCSDEELIADARREYAIPQRAFHGGPEAFVIEQLNAVVDHHYATRHPGRSLT